MRLAIFVCGFALISGPVFGQQSGLMMEAPPQPVLMPSAPKIASEGGAEAQKQVDTHVNRQVNATQQLLQKEEARLQSQFAKLQQLRAAALEKQDKNELDRIEKLEKQVVADYEKRVQRVFASAQAQIQATPIHVKGAQSQQQQQQANKAAPAKAEQAQARSSRTQTRSAKTQQQTKSQSSRSKYNRSQYNRSQYNRSQSSANTRAQSQQQQTSRQGQSNSYSSRYRRYGRSGQ